MLVGTNIQQLFSKIYFFKGKASFNPNTLNNQPSTYLLANHWQSINAGRGSTLESPTCDQDYWKNIKQQDRNTYTYQKWYQLIKDVHQFETEISKILDKYGKTDKTDKTDKSYKINKLFNNWSVDGDAMALTEYITTSYFDGEQIKTFSDQQKFPITSKLGAHKSIISDQDTDAQSYSTWFGMQLKLSQNDIVKFKPTSFRNMGRRVYGAGGASTYKADWFFTGQIDKKYTPYVSLKSKFKQYLDKHIYFRKLQYRFNLENKTSNVVGFFTESQAQDYNLPNLQNWRQLIIHHSQILYIKETQKGYLVDFSNAIVDLESSETQPIYPSNLVISVSVPDQFTDSKLINILKFSSQDENEIRNIFENQSGVIFVKKQQEDLSILGKKLTVSYQLGFTDSDVYINEQVTEPKYYYCIKNPVTKSIIQQNITKDKQRHLNEVELQISCTSYGEKVDNKQLILQVSGRANPAEPIAVIDNIYYCQKKFDEIVEYVLNLNVDGDQDLRCFKEKYSSLAKIKQQTYQNKFNDIQAVYKTMYNKKLYTYKDTQGDNRNLWGRTSPSSSTKITKDDIFKLQKRFNSVRFIDGKAKLKLNLNPQLTSENNPRHQFARSLALNCYLHINNGNYVTFNTIFFQTDLKIQKKIDWVNHAGPFLRTMGLMYPAMQKIVDLYNFKSIVMPAMKRAFDVEDQSHPRYMPTTRQISTLQHRQIRKWLYEPLYNSSLCLKSKKQQKTSLKQKIGHTKITQQQIITLFREKKRILTESLKKAFTLQLSTIPLYLSAMFSTNHLNLKKVLRSVSIDEMKHLFIISNVLNAIQQKSQNPKAVPYLDPNYIPSFPTHLVQVLNAKNQHLRDFLYFDIQPYYTSDQLLRFICIQLPAQLDQISIQDPTNLSICQQKKKRIKKLRKKIDQIKCQQKNNHEFKTIGQFYGQVIEGFWELDDIEKYYLKNYCQNKKPQIKFFSGDPRHQFTYHGLQNMIQIYDLRSALNQFRLIVAEGQGANLFSVNAQIQKQSHFVKFIQIYTGCQVSYDIKNPQSDQAQVIIKFQEDESLLLEKQDTQDHKKDRDNWTQQKDKQFDAKINNLLCSQRISSNQNSKNYADTYAKPAFLNAYQKLMEELDYIFNSDLDQFKKFYQEEFQNIDELELKRRFQIARRAKMQNAIAKMRQMTLHSNHIITPIGGNPDPTKQHLIGSRPSYNVDFEEKTSIKCPSSSNKQKK